MSLKEIRFLGVAGVTAGRHSWGEMRHLAPELDLPLGLVSQVVCVREENGHNFIFTLTTKSISMYILVMESIG